MTRLASSRLRTFVVAASLLFFLGATARAFAYPAAPSSKSRLDNNNNRMNNFNAAMMSHPKQQLLRRLVTFRGGAGEGPVATNVDEGSTDAADSPATTATSKEEETASSTADDSSSSSNQQKGRRSLLSVSVPSSASALLASIAKNYGAALDKRPILTKSITAGCIFTFSDFLAQRLEQRSSSNIVINNKDKKQQSQAALNWARLLSATAIGLFYFGPAAHYWYETIFRLLPGTTLISILQKAALGQAFFGPTITCIFFASSLIQSGKFSMSNWMTKIKKDLPGAWLAGVGFWPLVDLVSYGFIPKNYIPLFVNIMSLIWTIYLSMVANR